MPVRYPFGELTAVLVMGSSSEVLGYFDRGEKTGEYVLEG